MKIKKPENKQNTPFDDETSQAFEEISNILERMDFNKRACMKLKEFLDNKELDSEKLKNLSEDEIKQNKV